MGDPVLFLQKIYSIARFPTDHMSSKFRQVWGICHRNGRTALKGIGPTHLPSTATLSLPASLHSAFDRK